MGLKHIGNKWMILTVVYSVVFGGQGAWAFSSGEHAVIGDEALKLANPEFANNIKGLEAKIHYSYGQLVALSGDFFKNVERLAFEDPSVLSEFHGRNREGLKKCIDEEVHAIRTEQVYGGCGEMKLMQKRVNYVALAHDNYSHFAWHNIKLYVEEHSRALWFAQLAHLKCDKHQWDITPKQCQKNEETLHRLVDASHYKNKLKAKYRRLPELFPRKRFTKRYLKEMPKEKLIRTALFTNAFADHFLTDAFSSGHMRVPRSQIDEFVKNNALIQSDEREKGSSISGALTQFLHNLDGTLTGLPVTNSLGHQFVSRSDKQLFSKMGSEQLSGIVEKNPQLKLPLQAAHQSLNEVFAVIKNGASAMPTGEYVALQYVPFIQPDKAPSLVEVVKQRVASEGETQDVIDTMSNEMQLIFRGRLAIRDKNSGSYKSYFDAFVDALPDMMAQFRAQIEAEARNDSLQARIPPKLLQALKTIN